MEQLVLENDALVRFVVKKYAGRGKEYDDLYQLGRLGLMHAIENFDRSYHVKFSTYAVPAIMGEIRRFLRDDRQIHISRTIRENAGKVIACTNAYACRCEASPSVSEISTETGLSKDDVVLAMGASMPVRSLCEPIGDEGGRMLQDTIGVDPFEKVEKNLLVQSLFGLLNEKEKQLISLRYFERLTQVKTAEIMGLTQVQVSRLEKKVLLFLRKNAV